MSYYGLTPSKVRELTAGGTLFFSADLEPIEPAEGQWFCEFHIRPTLEDEEICDEAIVEYLGPDTKHVLYGDQWQAIHTHRVASEYDESDREPRGDILILQA